MSMPTFPESGIYLTKEQALHMLLGSIAMEELSMSHILNAEGEKIQYMLGTLPGSPPACITTSELLKVNNSVIQVLEQINYSQLLLKSKMQAVLDAMECITPLKIACILTTPTCLSWKSHCPLEWQLLHCEGATSCFKKECATKIFLPGLKSFLLHYSFHILTTLAEHVSISLQCIENGNYNHLASHTTCSHTTSSHTTNFIANITGSTIVPCSTSCEHMILCFTLEKGSNVVVQQGLLNITEV